MFIDLVLKTKMRKDVINMVDMHMHTVYSDGDKTVEEILKMCEDKKLEYISLTDHDSVNQYKDEALKNNNLFSGKIIMGSELHAVFNNKKIEVLGYNINIDMISEWLEKYYSNEMLIKSQELNYRTLLEIFDRQGIIYNEERIRKPEKPTDYVEPAIYEEAMRHIENHSILGECVESFGMFFRKGLTNPKSVYFMKPVGIPDYKEVINIIHNSGGKAFLAHPYEYRFEDTIGFIDCLRKESELDGIECFHPSVDLEKREILLNYSKQNNLFISGGSDYHGKIKPDIKIGIGKGDLNIPKDIIEEWANDTVE